MLWIGILLREYKKCVVYKDKAAAIEKDVWKEIEMIAYNTITIDGVLWSSACGEEPVSIFES